MVSTINYKNGNQLSYAEYGDSKGYPVLIQHGMIASIQDYQLFNRLIEAGTHLISIARPGYGQSSPYMMKDVAEWGEIVSVLVQELHLTQCDIFGISSGAPYSYAIGYKLPDKIRNIFILSGTPALYDDSIVQHWPYPIQRNAMMNELQPLARELFFSNLSEADLERTDIKDSMMNNCFGIALDLRIRCMEWGFRLSDVKEHIYMQHSVEDNQVPFITAEMTARMLPNCELDRREKSGHFSTEILDSFIETAMIDICKRAT